jgi:hypothetical protein
MSFADWLKKWIPKEFKVGYDSGPAFDPTTQERTDPLRDIAEKKPLNIKDKK